MLIILRLWAGIAVFLPFLLVATVAAGELERVNTGSDRVAIQGYDTVAYFTVGEPTKGLAEYEHEWQGATWRFAKSEHRDLFATNPDKYAPRFGGFCAMGVSLGKQAGADPEAWAIVEGRLYLAYNKEAMNALKKDASGHIAKAEANWDKMVQGN